MDLGRQSVAECGIDRALSTDHILVPKSRGDDQHAEMPSPRFRPPMPQVFGTVVLDFEVLRIESPLD